MVADHSIRSEAMRFLADPVTRMLFFSGCLRTSRQVFAAMKVEPIIPNARASAASGGRLMLRKDFCGVVSVLIIGLALMGDG